MIQKSLPIVQIESGTENSSSARDAPSCCDSPESTNSSPFVWTRLTWTRIVVAIYLTGIALVVALVINTTNEITTASRHGLQALLIGLTTSVFCLLGPDFVIGTWLAARKRQASLEFLILLAMLGAFFYSVISVLRGAGAVYFEVICILLIIYGLGRRLKTNARLSAIGRANSWRASSYLASVLTDDGTIKSVDVELVKLGQFVIVYPGQMIPVDGQIVSGVGLIRQAALTGESIPVTRIVGQRVFAGTICIDATLTIKATSNGDNRVVDQIRSAVERAKQTPSRIEDLTQRVAHWFFPMVALGAIATAVAWGPSGNWDVAFLNASAVLLVACPCALGLATPIAVWAALSEVASRGLVAKHGDAVLSLAKVDLVCFDKTGTLTSNEPQAVLFTSSEVANWTPNEIKSIIATIQRTSEHPFAVAMRQLSSPDPRFQPRDIRSLAGRGIACQLEDLNSNRVIDVEISRTDEPEISVPCTNRGEISTKQQNRHLLNVFFDAQAVAQVELSESVPTTLPLLIEDLHAMGIKTAILSGDLQCRVDALSVFDQSVRKGGMLSGEKKDFVIQQKQHHTVLFVGDGFNDAEAMAAADVSIAAAWGTDFTAETADVVWLQRDLSSIVDAIKLGRRATSIIRSNLLLALGYNTIGISLAATGWLHPIAAAVLMLASSLTVTLRASGVGKR